MGVRLPHEMKMDAGTRSPRVPFAGRELRVLFLFKAGVFKAQGAAVLFDDELDVQGHAIGDDRLDL